MRSGRLLKLERKLCVADSKGGIDTVPLFLLPIKLVGAKLSNIGKPRSPVRSNGIKVVMCCPVGEVRSLQGKIN
jgi:hypothetical protein